MDPTLITLAPETLAALKAANTQNEWLPAISAIGGAVVGGLVSYLPNKFLEKHKREMEADAVRNALITEIRAIVAIIDERGYFRTMEAVIQQLTHSGGVSGFTVRVPDHYSRVYQAQVSRIGLLAPELATQIITFHQLIDAVVQDISPGGLIAEKGGNLEHFKILRDIFGRALASAHRIISEDDAKRENVAAANRL